MIQIPINEEFNGKWLTRELQAAGVTVAGVEIFWDEAGAFVSGSATVAEADEALAIATIAAHDPEQTPDVLEGVDFDALANKITNELAWIVTARSDIADGIAIINGSATLAQMRGVVKGLAGIVDRVLQEQDEELRAWRRVIRRLP